MKAIERDSFFAVVSMNLIHTENKRFEKVFDEFKDISDFIVANRVTDEINLLQERR